MASDYVPNDVVCAVKQALFVQYNLVPSIHQDQHSATYPSFSLPYLQHILEKDYGANMSEQEKCAFKIATVLFPMAYFLAPTQPFYAFPQVRDEMDGATADAGVKTCHYLVTLRQWRRMLRNLGGADKCDIYNLQ